jgi:4-amino-4-deoxy-L-arabinose transferase-like glycosyltransferase
LTSTKRSGWLRSEILLLALILSLAVFFRLWHQGQTPPGMYFDEAFESLEAHRILTEPGYHPIFFSANNGVPPLNIYLTALAFLIAGEHALSIRYVAALVGSLTILTTYLLARRLFARPTSHRDRAQRYVPLVAALILAVLPWHVALSRQGVEVALLPLWAALALLFLWQGLETGKTRHFAISGFFWGTCPYTYQAAVFLPGLLVLFLLYKVFQEHGFLGRYWRQLAVLALVALLSLLPLAAFVHDNPGAIVQRAQQVTIFSHGQGSDKPASTLVDNVLKVARVFAFGGDPNRADNIPGRAPLPAVLLLALAAGLLVALRRGRRAEYGLCLIWFVWMLLPSVLTEAAPSLRRAIGSTPAMAMLAAVGLAWILDGIRLLLERWNGRRMPAAVVSGLLACGVLIYAAAWGYQYYFVDWAGDKALFYEFDAGIVELGQIAAASPAGTGLYFTPAPLGDVLHLPLTWQVRDRGLRSFDGHWGTVLAPPGPHPSLYLVKTFREDAQTLPELQQFYPAGRIVQEVDDLYGTPYAVAFAVGPGTSPVLPIHNRISANFENQVELLGSNFSRSAVQAGDTLTVTLFLRSPAGPTQASHTVFTHLVGPPNPANGSSLWAGHDSPPLHNSYPTIHWAQGEIIVDQHPFVVPLDTPAGAYQVEVGLYTPDNGSARLNVLDPDGKVSGDSVLVGTVSVQR